MDHVLNEEFGEGDLVNSLGLFIESCIKLKRNPSNPSFRDLECSKGIAPSAVVQFCGLKSMILSYPEQTGLVSSLSHTETLKEKATRLWKEDL